MALEKWQLDLCTQLHWLTFECANRISCHNNLIKSVLQLSCLLLILWLVVSHTLTTQTTKIQLYITMLAKQFFCHVAFIAAVAVATWKGMLVVGGVEYALQCCLLRVQILIKLLTFLHFSSVSVYLLWHYIQHVQLLPAVAWKLN